MIHNSGNCEFVETQVNRGILIGFSNTIGKLKSDERAHVKLY